MKNLTKQLFHNSVTRQIAKRVWAAVPKVVHRWAPNPGKSEESVSHNSYHLDGTLAAMAYRQFNRNEPDVEDNYVPELFQKAVEFGYVDWPRKIQSQVHGKRVLDVCCGTGLHGIAYIIAGARSYTGLDPQMELDNDLGKNHRNGEIERLGATPREIMAQMPRIRLVPGTFEDMAPEEEFDLIVLHDVTEHLHNIEIVFKGISERLHAEGALLFHHHNFFCWNGHHLSPRTVAQIDFGDPKQAELIDWNHLTFEPPDDHYIRQSLNRIHLDDLRLLTERYFDISQWDEIRATESEGGNRLTRDILTRHNQYSERELAVKNVLCTAHHKGFLERHQASRKAGKPSTRERDMRRDEIFMTFYGRCKPYTMTTMERLYGLYQAIHYLQANNIEGDIVECGVWRGGSMMMAALSILHFGGPERQLYLFDTFQGMPEPTEHDFKFGEDSAYQKWLDSKRDIGSTWNYAPVDAVREAMESTGYPKRRLHLVPGMVETTLPDSAPQRIALLRLDTDFYASTLHEFEHMYPRLAQNGVLIVDDFGTWAGSAKATQEYFERHGISMLLNRLDAGGRLGVKSQAAQCQRP